MIHRVEETEEVLTDLATFTAEGLTSYLELRASLELTPWAGSQYNPDNPAGANMRTHVFGSGHGLAIYVIIEHPQIDEYRIVVTKVTWIQPTSQITGSAERRGSDTVTWARPS